MKTNDPKKLALLESLKGGLIVSCQTQKDEPIYTEDMVVKYGMRIQTYLLLLQ